MPKPKRTRGTAQEDEHLNSPVTDPGYWPYDRLAGGLQETLAGVPEPPDPGGYTPKIGKRERHEPGFNEGAD